MAITGSCVEDFVNGMVHVTVDWSAVPDGNTDKLKLTFNIYFDASGAQRISSIAATTTSYIDFNNKKYYFSTPKITGTEKTLIGTVAISVSIDDIKSAEKSGTADGENLAGGSVIRPEVCLNFAKFQAYTGLISYVNSGGAMYMDLEGIKSAVIKPSGIGFSKSLVLGADNNIVVTKNNDEFTHTITYVCGTASGTLCEKESNATVPFNLPLSLASQETQGTRLGITFTITTYYGNVPIATDTGGAYCSIPDTVKPSCTVVVTEGAYKNGQPIADIYDGYVQKQSMLHIVVTPIPKYGAPIVSYSIVANGSVFKEADITTGVLKNSGPQEVLVTVTDSRGRTSEIVTETIDVIPYSLPAVTHLKINRCDKDGIEQAETKNNDHIKVIFDANVSPINDKNTARYTLRYQKTSGLNQEDRVLTEYNDVYSVTGGTCIFEAAVRDSYDITIIAADDFSEKSLTTGGSTATTIYNVLASGLGMRFGGLATLENVIENSFLSYPSGGFMFPTIEKKTDDEEIDILDYKTPNIYIVKSGADVDKSPTTDSYTLIVLPTDDADDVIYIVITKNLEIYINRIADSSWGVWKTFTLTSV